MMAVSMSMMTMMIMKSLVDDDLFVHDDLVGVVLSMITLLGTLGEVHTASAAEPDGHLVVVALGSTLISVDLSVRRADTFESGVVAAAALTFSDEALVLALGWVHVVAHEELLDVHEFTLGSTVVSDHGTVLNAGSGEERVVNALAETGLDGVHVLGSEEVVSPGPAGEGGLALNLSRLVHWCGSWHLNWSWGGLVDDDFSRSLDGRSNILWLGWDLDVVVMVGDSGSLGGVVVMAGDSWGLNLDLDRGLNLDRSLNLNLSIMVMVSGAVGRVGNRQHASEAGARDWVWHTVRIRHREEDEREED